jgi:hypothetical protein
MYDCCSDPIGTPLFSQRQSAISPFQPSCLRIFVIGHAVLFSAQLFIQHATLRLTSFKIWHAIKAIQEARDGIHMQVAENCIKMYQSKMSRN